MNNHPTLSNSQSKSNSSQFFPNSPAQFLNWLKEKHEEELKKLQAFISPLQPQSIPFPNCLAQFSRHRWSSFAVQLPQGKIFQCQFCFHEKLVPPTPKEFTQYFPPQTYYIRN